MGLKPYSRARVRFLNACSAAKSPAPSMPSRSGWRARSAVENVHWRAVC